LDIFLEIFSNIADRDFVQKMN